jgi:hypothetical protein
MYFEEKTYHDSNAKLDFDKDLLNLWDFIFQTWIAIVKGDYKEQNSLEY